MEQYKQWKEIVSFLDNDQCQFSSVKVDQVFGLE